MMKWTMVLIVPILLSFCKIDILSSYSSKQNDVSVSFFRYYKEYGWKKYDDDSVALRNPIIPVLIASYPLEYKVNSDELIIYKLISSSDKAIVYSHKLARQQSEDIAALIDHANADSLKAVSTSQISDDGFVVDVQFAKNGNTTKFLWSNTYVPGLVKILSVVNDTAPDEYKVYKKIDEVAFWNFLKGLN